MITLRRAALAVLVLSACTPAPPPPPPPPAPAAPPVDEADARRAVDVALGALSKRNFDVADCSSLALSVRIVTDEATARAGVPIGEHCTMLVTRRADRTWLVAVRPATTAAPTRAGGSLAIVTVTPGGEGVTHIDYAR